MVCSFKLSLHNINVIVRQIIMERNINYSRIEKAIKYLCENYKEQPSLEEVAQYVGMSKFHFQRIFSEWAGVTPKQFVEHLTVEALKEELIKTNNLITASENVGLSTQSRAYDLMVKIEAMTPGEYKKHGKNLEINYGTITTPFGEAFIALTGRGICSFEFVDNDFEAVLQSVKDKWIDATFIHNNNAVQEVAEHIFSNEKGEIKLFLKGTPFQIKVWRALLSIPSGNVTSYSQLAEIVEMSSAVRAVASAVAKNPVGLIIPCHRVIRREGIVGEYHWRSERKKTILGWEISNKK